MLLMMARRHAVTPVRDFKSMQVKLARVSHCTIEEMVMRFSNSRKSCVTARAEQHSVQGQSRNVRVNTEDRRRVLQAIVATSIGSLLAVPSAEALSCPGLNGFALKQCLREARQAREAAEEAGLDPATGQPLSVEEERLKRAQYEQPGTLVTLPSGVQYREIDVGTSGSVADLGATVEIQYTVYRLSSGAYFKYSSGGTPVLLWAMGSGFEGQDDVDEVYRFRLGDPESLPRAATPAVVGMKTGGRRRILVPPRAGWVNDKVGPRPPTFGGQRRLAAHRDEPLLLEVVMKRVIPGVSATPSGQSQGSSQGSSDSLLLPGQTYRLPAPPTPFKDKLA